MQSSSYGLKLSSRQNGKHTFEDLDLFLNEFDTYKIVKDVIIQYERN